MVSVYSLDDFRTGFFSEKCKGKIHLKAGATVELTTDYSFKGDETKFACTYDKLPTSVKKGSTILIADGSLVRTLKGHTNTVHSAAFTPTGTHLATSSSDLSIKLNNRKRDA